MSLMFTSDENDRKSEPYDLLNGEIHRYDNGRSFFFSSPTSSGAFKYYFTILSRYNIVEVEHPRVQKKKR